MLESLQILLSSNFTISSGPIPDGSPNKTAIFFFIVRHFFSLPHILDYVYISHYKLTKEGNNEKKL